MYRWRVTYKTTAGRTDFKLVDAEHRIAAIKRARAVLAANGLGRSKIIGVRSY